MYSASIEEMSYCISSTCYKRISGNTILCSACSQQLSFIQRKCSDSVRMRLNGVDSANTNNRFLYNSPSLIKHKVDRLAQNAKSESVKRSKAKAKKNTEDGDRERWY